MPKQEDVSQPVGVNKRKKEGPGSEYALKPGHGRLFVAEKQPNSNQPNMRGTINVDDVVYDISGWEHKAPNGKKYLALALRKKSERSIREDYIDQLLSSE